MSLLASLLGRRFFLCFPVQPPFSPADFAISSVNEKSLPSEDCSAGTCLSALPALHRAPPSNVDKEARILLKKLSLRLAKKWEKPRSEVRGFVIAHASAATVRATHLCLCGSRIPTSKARNCLLQWEDKAGPGLFRGWDPSEPALIGALLLLRPAQDATCSGSQLEPVRAAANASGSQSARSLCFSLPTKLAACFPLSVDGWKMGSDAALRAARKAREDCRTIVSCLTARAFGSASDAKTEKRSSRRLHALTLWPVSRTRLSCERARCARVALPSWIKDQVSRVKR